LDKAALRWNKQFITLKKN